MDYFAGLDISMDETHVCVLDREGLVVRESKTASTADAIAGELAKAPSCRRIVWSTSRDALPHWPNGAPSRPKRPLGSGGVLRHTQTTGRYYDQAVAIAAVHDLVDLIESDGLQGHRCCDKNSELSRRNWGGRRIGCRLRLNLPPLRRALRSPFATRAKVKTCPRRLRGRAFHRERKSCAYRR